MSQPEKILYTAHTTSTGGRNGSSRTDDGRLDVRLSVPKALGGDDGPGTNPEQLFAAGYSCCFLGAMQVVAKKEMIQLPEDVTINAEVGIGPQGDGFGLTVKFDISASGIDQRTLEKVVNDAHQVCPYSRATRGNINVSLNVVEGN